MAVYFIRAGEIGPVKIGKADDPAVRMAEFQTAHYEDLSLLRTLPGGRAEEAWFHRHFRHMRIRREWFQFCPSMLTVEPSAPLASAPATPPVMLLPEYSARRAMFLHIQAFCRERGMTERQFGLTVMGDHKFISRLRSGRGVNSFTHDRIVAFLNGGPVPPRRPFGSAAHADAGPEPRSAMG